MNTNSFIMLTFMMSLLFGLCDSCSQTDGSAADNDSTVLRLAVLPTMECLPFYYADSTGIFDSLGVNVRLITFKAAMDADTAFQRGYADGIVTDLVKACLWQGAGDTAHVAMVGELRMWIVTAPKARLLKAESLKEKIIGVTRHSATDFFTDKVLASVKLHDIDLNKPQINNVWLRTLMVDQDQIDGAVLPEPYASEAVARGAKRLNGTADMGVENLMCVLFGDSLYRVRNGDIEKIREAYDKAVVAMNKDLQEDKLAYFPDEFELKMPDSLFRYVPMNVSVAYHDSMMTDVKIWAKGRNLIK